MTFKKGIAVLLLLALCSSIFADEEELIEGSKHIIALDLEARFEVDSDGNDISPRGSGSGSGFNFKYQYIFGLGIDINAEHAAPLFLFYQKPTYIGAEVGINSDKFDGDSVRSGSPFRVDFSQNLIDLQVDGQHYFKNGWGVNGKIKNTLSEGARFQIFDDSSVGDTGLEKLDQNELFIDLGVDKYFVTDRLLLGLDLGFSFISGDKPFHTGRKDDNNDISGSSFNIGFHIDYLFESEKWKFGFTYNYLSLDLDTDVVLNVGGRLTTSTADFSYGVNREESAHYLNFRVKHLYSNTLAFNYVYTYHMLTDDLNNDLEAQGIPVVVERDVSVHRFTFSPEFWIFNRMKVAFDTGFLFYDFKETGSTPINVGGQIFEANTQEYEYLTWFVGINVDILF